MVEFDIEAYDDVEPLSIETNLDDELCQIMYTDEYKKVMGIARRLLSQKEYSQRALTLTSQVIGMSPAFYTIWNYRFNIIKKLASSSDCDKAVFFNKELDWLDEVTLNNPKNYQIWSYRQALLDAHPCPTLKRELPILEMMIDEDTKNYHVWSYRKWCIKKFQDFKNEFEYSNTLIERDIYNNSAWTHRMFVTKNILDNDNTLDVNSRKELLNFETEYTKQKISQVPQNVSSWNYLRGINDLYFNGDYSINGLDIFAMQFVDNVLEIKLEDLTGNNTSNLPIIKSSFALHYIGDAYSKTLERIPEAIKAYKALSIKYDPIRKGLWDHRIATISKLIK